MISQFPKTTEELEAKHLREWYQEQARGVDPANFTKYLNREGLEVEEADSLTLFVIKLCRVMGNQWKPQNCTVVPQLTPFANEIYRRTFTSDPLFAELVAKRFLHDHFFWASKLYRTGEPLILDPAGVPANLSKVVISEITPYFGLSGKAQHPKEIVYRNMEDMDDWGTRDFPSGFHP